MKTALYLICALLLSALVFAPMPEKRSKEDAGPPGTVTELVDSLAETDTAAVEVEIKELARKGDSFREKTSANLQYFRSAAPKVDSIQKDSGQ